jgi:hypothetical protein
MAAIADTKPLSLPLVARRVRLTRQAVWQAVQRGQLRATWQPSQPGQYGTLNRDGERGRWLVSAADFRDWLTTPYVAAMRPEIVRRVLSLSATSYNPRGTP